MTARMKDDGLLIHLRLWGLRVEGKTGWRFRGRPYDFLPRAIIAHHTASNAKSGNFASENIVTYGRSDLKGPLCQFLLGRDGAVKVIATGYANHAGYGGPKAGIPTNQGNTYSIGIEAENNGIGEPWSAEQLNAYYRLCAALLDWIGVDDVSKVIGHKEWTSRKIDPSGINMDKFRYNVQLAYNAGPSALKISVSKVQPGKKNSDVLKLKKKMYAKGYRGFFVNNDGFGLGLKRAYAKYQRSLGYSGSDADGRPGISSLSRLGFYPTK